NLEQPPVAEQDVLGQTSANVMVNGSPASHMIRLSIDSADPKYAAAYANALADEFVRDRMEARWQTTQEASDWVIHQLAPLKEDAESSESALESYAAVKTSDDSKARQIQGQLAAVQADLRAKQAHYDQAVNGASDAPAGNDDEQLRAVRQKLADARRELAD